jgi:putative CocE/NonD family hydrolase
MEITGQPQVSLYVEVDRDDAAFFVYLEDVDPQGVVRYLTEGEMRAIDRKISSRPPPYLVLGPNHSWRREDAQPLIPGQISELTFAMMPISALVRSGHRLRVAVGGADSDTFERVPVAGDTVFRIHSDGNRLSHVLLPIVKPPKE